jgi:hypothetical protein
MVAKEFNRLVYESTGWRGAYPLVIPIQVGDYFQLNEQGVPIDLGNALDWPGWRAAVPVDRETIGGSETYYAGCQRQAAPEAGGGAKVPGGLGAEATLSLSFTRSAGFVLAYNAATRSRVRDAAAVRQSILASAKAGWWQEDWILVTEVIEAESATLAVATEAGSQIDLHANVAIPDGIIAGVSIADPKLGWTASSWRGSGYSSVCNRGTPLYHCMRVRKGIFGKWRAELLDEQEPDAVFTDDPFDIGDDGSE